LRPGSLLRRCGAGDSVVAVLVSGLAARLLELDREIKDLDKLLANRFRAGLDLAHGDSAIVSAAIPDADRKLAAAGIRAATRAGDLRVSFHIYSTENDVDTALNALTG